MFTAGNNIVKMRLNSVSCKDVSYMKFLQGQKLLQHIEAMVMTLRVPTIAVTALIGLGTMHLIIKKYYISNWFCC
jgi:hypothetical protein